MSTMWLSGELGPELCLPVLMWFFMDASWSPGSPYPQVDMRKAASGLFSVFA